MDTEQGLKGIHPVPRQDVLPFFTAAVAYQGNPPAAGRAIEAEPLFVQQGGSALSAQEIELVSAVVPEHTECSVAALDI
jgi:hypothetical protein